MMQIMREMSCGFHRALATGHIITITSFSWRFLTHFLNQFSYVGGQGSLCVCVFACVPVQGASGCDGVCSVGQKEEDIFVLAVI